MRHPLTPGPPRVQIQTQAGCNGRCIFCPNEDVLKSDLEHGRMPLEMFEKIVDDLAKTPPRRVGMYMQNEPLLDKRLPQLTKHVTERIPGAKTQVITNGTYLSEQVGEALLDAGLKQLKCSLQSLDPETNREIMGYDSRKVIENCVAFQKLIKKKKSDIDFRVSMVVTNKNVDEIPATRKFWAKHGVRLVTSALENRGGNIAGAAQLNVGDMRSMGNCIRPSRDMMILFNGDVPLCCVDWHRTYVVGNVYKQSVQEVWYAAPVTQVRDALAEEDTSKMPDICRNCTESACPNAHRRGLKGLLGRLAAAF
ncbi:MAG: radical SAM protein [Candidatus Hydrogenedentes bacterium]|nr:radical SAM protein [Candidatus Hydrogenedentota bacterium]